MDPGRFLVDLSLEGLARRLRLLGFDVATLPGARLETLFEAAGRDGRTVLTTSARHPRRHARVRAVTVDRGDPVRAVRSLVAAYAPPGAPFSRCSVCNEPLGDGPGRRGTVPERVRASGTPLRHCPRCRRTYWHGTHVERLRAWLEVATGNPVPTDDR